MQIEGTAVAISGRGLLLTGQSGAGKSDMALRLIDGGAVLIGDDAVSLSCANGQLMINAARSQVAPLFVRGIGIVSYPVIAEPVPLSLALTLVPAPSEPSAALGIAGPWFDQFVPNLELFPFESSAISKVMLAMSRFGH